MTERADPPARGINPEPETGWPSHLTDYEVSYVRRFSTRPERGNGWPVTLEQEQHLDHEADGIRKTRQRARNRVRRNWPWVTATAILTAVTVAGGAFGTLLITDTHALNTDTTSIRQSITDGR